MTAAEVFLWGTRIGTVALVQGARVARFEYDRDFIRSGIEVSPVAMPLGPSVYSFPELPFRTFKGLPGLLYDSLPDKFGTAVIDGWLESQGRPAGSLDAVERLCYVGTRAMGALEYRPTFDIGAVGARDIKVEELARLADCILAKRRDLVVEAGDLAMRQLFEVGTSAGGARAKAVIAWNERTGEIRSGQVDAGPGFSHWLVKFDKVSSNGDKEGADSPGYTRIEFAYYLMARAAGVEMSECRLLEEGGGSHFMTRRFDRLAETGGKVHMQTLSALAHFDFNDPVSYSYEQAVRVMRLIGLGQDEVEELFRRMVFNIAARNHDDHVKNISFLMDRRGRWSLSPAYDVTYAYNPAGEWTGAHQMSANGKRDGFDRDDLLAAAAHMSIPRAKARAIIEQVFDAVRRWPSFAEQVGVAQQTAEAIDGLLLWGDL